MRRRAGLIAVLAAFLVAAAVVEHGRPPAAVIRAAATALAVPPPTTEAAAWFCAEGTPGGRADEAITVANAGRRGVAVTFTALHGTKQPPVARTVTVGPRSQLTARLADLTDAADAGVVVETFGGDVAVEHEIAANHDFALAPCARHAASRWYFASGATSRDAREYLTLFNPFADDAVVDVTFVTTDGVKRPQALRALVVPASSRLSVPVHDHVPRQDQVSTIVAVPRGRVVAEETLIYDGSAGRFGLALVPGVTEPARHLAFADGFNGDGVVERVAVLNPGDEAIDVEVQTHIDGDQVLEPQQLSIPARSTVLADAGAHVPKGVGYATVVEVPGRGPGGVVAERVVVANPPAPRRAFDVDAPSGAPAARWLFAAGRADTVRDEWLAVFNPGPRPVTFSITVLAAGQPLVPQGLGAVAVAPGRRSVLRLGDALQRPDTALVVAASAPVYVQRGLFSEGVSFAPGIPYR
jgi:hypothetical protein